MVATRNLRKRNQEEKQKTENKRFRRNVREREKEDRDQLSELPESSRSTSSKKLMSLSKDLTKRKNSKKGKEKENSVIEEDEQEHSEKIEESIVDSIAMEGAVEEDEEEEEDEDEIDWETVELPKFTTEQPQGVEAMPVYKDVEITFQAPRAVLKKSRWEIEYQKNLREWTHNSHIITLVAHYSIRNMWCSNEQLKSQCLKIIPDHAKKLLLNQSSEQSMIIGIKWILKWWKEYFSITGIGLITRPFSDFADMNPSFLQKMINEKESNENTEWIGDLQNFIKILSKREGSSDVCSELFVAILRSCGCETRLVCSLQPVPYKIPPESTLKKDKKEDSKEPQGSESKEDSKDEKPELLFQFRTPFKSYVNQNVQLRQTNAKPPIVWAEVYCPETRRWLSIDPIRGLVDMPGLMEPAALNRSNQLSFVLAFDEKRKHAITDVTRRYTSNMEKAVRLRGRPLTKREQSAGMKPWFQVFLETICHKAKMGERERSELQELEKQENKEKMPTSIGAFKNHSTYALERHLKKFEVLHPKQPILGSIRGEKIYPRQCVKTVATADSFRKQGREIIKGEQPVKMVKSTATTIEKKRIHELAKQDGQEVLTPCYGEWQTQKIIPDPVIDGKISKNSYGNIDLFTPEMLPAGAVHIPIKGIAKIAKRLDIDYADAVTGFEFVKMRSVPIIDGIVIAEEFRYVIMEALEEQEQEEAMKAIKKQEKEVYLRWRKLIKGLLIKARVDNEYGKTKDDMWSTFNNNEGGGGFLPDDE